MSASGSPRNSARAWRAASPDAAARRLADQPLEAQRVDQVAVDLQLVAAPARDDLGVAAAGEQLAQPPHVVLDHLARARRRLLTPQALDQPVCGDEPVGLEAEHRQDRPLFRTAQRDGALISACLDGSQ